MNQPIRPTVSVVQRQNFAKRSGIGLITQPSLPSPSRQVYSSQKFLPPAIAIPVEDLEMIYLVEHNKNTDCMCLNVPPGKGPTHTLEKTKAIVAILEKNQVKSKKTKFAVVTNSIRDVFDRKCRGGKPLEWFHPVKATKTIFIIKEDDNLNLAPQNAGRGRPPGSGKLQIKKMAPRPQTKNVEVIDLDSDSEEEQPLTIAQIARSQMETKAVSKPVSSKPRLVIRGSDFSLPSKRIVPAGKTISCLYKIRDINQITKRAVGPVNFLNHPFLGDQFMIVNCKLKEEKKPLEIKRPVLKELEKKKRIEVPEVTKKLTKIEESDYDSDDSLFEPSRRNSKRQKSSNKTLPKKSTQPPRRTRYEAKSSSSSQSSSDSSSEVESSSEESSTSTKRKAVVTKNNSKKQVSKPPPRCFAETKPNRPIRKSPDGRIYFSLKAKVHPDEYYKNEDLFVNWEKFTRNESEVAHYYKTMLMKTLHTTLVIYRMEKVNDKLVVDRSVEMVSDGTIKVTLKGEDVTDIFLKYVNIEMNTHLSLLLLNLINSSPCCGCKNFSLISVYPEAELRDNVWFSGKCTRVVFNEPDKFTTNYSYGDKMCGGCIELKKRLEAETSETYKKTSFKKTVTKTQKRGRAQNAVVYGKYKPPPVEHMQVRKALSDLFQDFWKQLGFKEEEFPNESVDIKVDVVSEKDFPEIKENEELIKGLPSLPESIPILENIDFDENGQTTLTFSEIPLNPYVSNVQLMDSNIPEFSSDIIDSIMNSSDSLLQSLVPTISQGSNQLNENAPTDQRQNYYNNQQQEFQHYQNEFNIQQAPYDQPQNFNTSDFQNYQHLDSDIAQSLGIDLQQESDESGLMFPTFSLTEL